MLTLVIVTTSVSVVFAYLQLNPKDTHARVEAVFPPRELSMKLEKTVFDLGEDVSITISVQNIGNETITVAWGSAAMFDFDVLDANGTFVYRFTYAYLFAFMEHRVSLFPGEEFSLTRKWDQTRMTIVDDQMLEYGIPVKRGVYSITGKLNSRGDVVTPPITITIV